MVEDTTGRLDGSDQRKEPSTHLLQKAGRRFGRNFMESGTRGQSAFRLVVAPFLRVRVRSAIITVMLFSTVLLAGALAEAQSTDSATGIWVGTLTQGTGAPYHNFVFQMDLVQDLSGNVTGSSFNQVSDQPTLWAFKSITGQVSNGVLTFQDGTITSQGTGFEWCDKKSGHLTFSSDGSSLAGDWASTNCVGGTINVSKIPRPAYNATGIWLGTIFNPAGDRAVFKMDLQQDDTGKVSGTDFRLEAPNFDTQSLAGQVSSVNFAYQGGQHRIPTSPAAEAWCILSGQLTFSPDGMKLDGNWQSADLAGTPCFGQGAPVNLARASTINLPLVSANGLGAASHLNRPTR